MTGDAVDHRVCSRETRLDLAGLAQHDPGDRRPLAVDPADGPEGEAAAGRGGRAGLDADEPVAPEQRVGVVHGAGDRQRRARRGDDRREHTQAHGPIDKAHLVGGSRHGCVVVAACWFGPAWTGDCPIWTAAWPCAGHTVLGSASPTAPWCSLRGTSMDDVAVEAEDANN